MNRIIFKLLAAAALSLCCAVLTQPEYAAALPTLPLQFGGPSYPVNQVLGDGKNGRQFRKWTQGLPERPVQSVSITLRRQSGGDGTFVNLRFGDGSTFENGKREYLRGGGTTTVNFEVGGQTPNGQPLVLNAYDGEVYVQSVRVSFVNQGSQPLPPRPRPRPPFNDQHDDRGGYDEGYGHGGYDQGGGQGGYLSGDQDRDAEERCRRARVQRPRIEVGRVRGTGGVFSGKFKVEGSIYGACIQEAGYFEEGRMKEPIRFRLDDRYNRQEFQITGRSGRRGEIRVYTTDGLEDRISIDDELRNSGGGFQ